MSLPFQLPTAWRHVALCKFHGWLVSFTLAENLEAILATRRQLKRRICDANIGVLFFVWWLLIRLVTWTSGREGETQILLSYIWLIKSRYQWPRGLRYGSATARLLGLRFRIPPWHGRLFFCECCALSRRGLCYGLVIRPHQEWFVGGWLRSPITDEALTNWGLSTAPYSIWLIKIS